VKCERCGEREATVHWTEFIDGMAFERNLCEDCRAEETPGGLPLQNEIRFQCRCGRSIDWQFPCGRCGHPAEAYEKAGRAEIEIATCGCGVKFFAVAPRWRCAVCGAESVVPPRDGGARGYLHDHIHGSAGAAEIQIRGMIP
jgi:protein-arginine kinase activator protein McsA